MVSNRAGIDTVMIVFTFVCTDNNSCKCTVLISVVYNVVYIGWSQQWQQEMMACADDVNGAQSASDGSGYNLTTSN